MKKIVVLTGAGISAESGLKTFRDSGGLWEGYRPEDVATPEAWEADRELVLRFYNERRRDAANARPNAAHIALAGLEATFDVKILTQNVDDLHERAGSTNVLHIHGKLGESRSTVDPDLVYEIEGTELNLGDTCEKNSQLRPNIVWFGEAVPLIEQAMHIAKTADIFIVVGTSLAVYPAASLIDFVPSKAQMYLIDPVIPAICDRFPNLTTHCETASSGVPKLANSLL